MKNVLFALLIIGFASCSKKVDKDALFAVYNAENPMIEYTIVIDNPNNTEIRGGYTSHLKDEFIEAGEKSMWVERTGNESFENQTEITFSTRKTPTIAARSDAFENFTMYLISNGDTLKQTTWWNISITP